MQKNTTNLVSCDTAQIKVVNAKKFMEEIGLSGICKIVQDKPPLTGGKMVFDNSKEIEIVEATTALQKSFIIIEVYNIGGLCLSFLNTPIDCSTTNGPFFFNISGIGFAIKQIPKPDKIEFEFEGIKYTVGIDAFHTNQVQLPGGQVLLIDWDEHTTYKPASFTALEFPQASPTDPCQYLPRNDVIDKHNSQVPIERELRGIIENGRTVYE